MLLCRYGLHWNWPPAQLAGLALSTTSLAVVYSVLAETGLTRTEIGKIIMASTFVTDFGTSAGLSLLFITPNAGTLWFGVVSVALIGLMPWVMPYVITSSIVSVIGRSGRIGRLDLPRYRRVSSRH